jgi:hypothetical protein
VSVRVRPPAPFAPTRFTTAEGPLWLPLRTPEQILSPGDGRLLNRKPGVKTEQPTRPHWFLEQLETGLGGCSSALLAIARTAARDDIGPRRRTTPRTRDDMVAGEFARPQLLAAVLAAELVSSVYVLAGKLDVPFSESNETKKPHNGRYTQAIAGRTHLAIRLLEYLDLLEENQFQRPLPVDHIQGFKRGIEQKDLTEGVHSFAEAANAVLANLDQKPGTINVFAKVGPKRASDSPPRCPTNTGPKKSIALSTYCVKINNEKGFVA